MEWEQTIIASVITIYHRSEFTAIIATFRQTSYNDFFYSTWDVTQTRRTIQDSELTYNYSNETRRLRCGEKAASFTRIEYKNLCDSSERQTKDLLFAVILYRPPSFGSNSVLFARDHIVGDRRFYIISTLVSPVTPPSRPSVSSFHSVF